ncbi:MAG: type II toxin-antitoxin system Phd/YefM family antitoxin, partial [Marinoscillum sp.]
SLLSFNQTVMDVTTFTDFRKNMRAYFEKVFTMGKPLFISRPKGQDMVLMSKAEYNSMQETFHLSSSSKNAGRLLKAVESDKAGEGKIRELLD